MKLNPHRLWVGLFVIWAILLSGVFAQSIGAPGLIQLYRLKVFHDSRLKKSEEVQAEIARLTFEAEQLNASRVVQLNEIRKVLGYVSPNEIVFDFARSQP